MQTAGRLQVREINNAASYLSSNDTRLHVGLGDAATVQQLDVLWPSGVRQTLTGVKANQILTVKEPRIVTRFASRFAVAKSPSHEFGRRGWSANPRSVTASRDSYRPNPNRAASARGASRSLPRDRLVLRRHACTALRPSCFAR